MSDSDPARPRSEKEIFFEALERHTPQERAAFLDGACGTNPVQRTRVEALLKDHFQEDAFMQEPALDVSPLALPVPPPVEAPSRMLGRYKLLQQIGEGGFGEVWMAEQCEPVKRRVALKIIKLGMDSRQIVARFEAERQALAMMDHANIARIFDADVTDTGRLYFVMELVRGIKITDYCDQNQLPTKERLDLFIKVCQAIQHAHQKGIIHRDIKPSNILVTLHDGVPVPKVIDFGIAKATQSQLTEKTVFTQFQHFIGTPAYISPEQAELSGLDVDTRADIYSLGVLLYELLVGQTPIDAREMMQGGLDALRQIIREREPQRPSTKLNTLVGDALTTAAKSRQTEAGKLVLQLQGDLDWIVMKCLEKDRTRRYETANSLAMDIQRHLANKPVVARPPSAAYQIQKAWQRNKLAFTAAVAVAVALLAGTGVSTWQAVEATRARKAEVVQRIAAQDAQAQAMIQQKKAEAERQRAEEQLTRAEGLVYAGKLLLAQTDFEAGNGGLALHYLDECQEKLRGWEHRYLRTRINARQTLTGHTNEVACVAFSPDGTWIVSGSGDGTAKVWDAATGAELLSLKKQAQPVASVAFSPDGKRLVTGTGNWSGAEKVPGEAKVWDTATGEELLSLKGPHDSIRSLAFSPDGQRIVTGSGNAYQPGEAKVWDASTGLALHSIKTYEVHSVAVSPDGRHILTGSMDQTARVWDAGTGGELFVLKGHRSGVRGAAFSPDGRFIVTCGDDSTARVWGASTGQEHRVLRGHTGSVFSAAFSPDSQRIVTSSRDQTAKVWDATTGEELFALKGHTGEVHSAAFSPDGKRIITGSRDRTVKVWDAVQGQEVPTLKDHNAVSSIAFSPDGKWIVTGSLDGRVRVWDTGTGKEILPLNGTARRMWNEAGVWSVAFSPDGKRIATGSQDKTAKVWDAVTGEELLVLQHPDAVSSVAFSPDGKRLVTGIGEWGTPGRKPGEAKVWDAVTGQDLLTLVHPNVVWSVAFSPDSQRIATGGADQKARVWDAVTGRELLALKGHTSWVSHVAFSFDGQRLLSGSMDRTAKVWDAATGRLIFDLKGHTGGVLDVVFSPDGQRIVTGSEDQTAKVWDAGTGQELLSLKEHTAGVWSVAFSPDGKRIVTGIAGADAVAKVWYAATTPQMAAWEQKEKTGGERPVPGRDALEKPAVK